MHICRTPTGATKLSHMATIYKKKSSCVLNKFLCNYPRGICCVNIPSTYLKKSINQYDCKRLNDLFETFVQFNNFIIGLDVAVASACFKSKVVRRTN